MVTLDNIPANLKYFLFKKNLSAREFSAQINEPHRTLLAIIQGKITKTNRDLSLKIAKAVGVELTYLQNELLEGASASFHTQLPILDYRSIELPIKNSNSIGSYNTLNSSLIDEHCFVVRTDKKFNYAPTIPKNCSVVLVPNIRKEDLKDSDTLLLLGHNKVPIFSIIEIRKKDKNTIISTLSNRLQVDDILMLNEFIKKYKILGKVIEIRHE